MAVQDLTPQLRTRLSRVEKEVGVFVVLATLLLLAGFGYYVYKTGERKGWWKFKARYHTFLQSATGLNVGSPVTLLGFTVGEITSITALPPEDIIWADYGNVYIQFYVLEPFHGYVWSDSRVRITGELLGGRQLSVLPGGISLEENPGAVLHATYKFKDGEALVLTNQQTGGYVAAEEVPKGFWLPANEAIAVTERLEEVAVQVQAALPGILDMTNRLNQVLSNVAQLTAQADETLTELQPMLSNVTVITANLTEPNGSLGQWLLPTNLNAQLNQTLAAAAVTLTNVNDAVVNTDSNVTTLTLSLDQTLINLANITSNLNQQVQRNTNILSSLSEMIIEADDLMQGLKTHWLLRSAFDNEDEEEPEDQSRDRSITPPPRAGKWRKYP